MDEWEQFRTLLRDRLKERGALARLAKASGLNSPVIGHWARGETRPSPANLERLAPALAIPYEELMRMAGYLPGEATVDPNPRLSAFLAQIEAAFHSMTDQEWQVREEAGRALFAVQPINKGERIGRREGVTNRRSGGRRVLDVHASTTDDSADQGGLSTVSHALKGLLALSLSAFRWPVERSIAPQPRMLVLPVPA